MPLHRRAVITSCWLMLWAIFNRRFRLQFWASLRTGSYGAVWTVIIIWPFDFKHHMFVPSKFSWSGKGHSAPGLVRSFLGLVMSILSARCEPIQPLGQARAPSCVYLRFASECSWCWQTAKDVFIQRWPESATRRSCRNYKHYRQNVSELSYSVDGTGIGCVVVDLLITLCTVTYWNQLQST